MFTTTSRFASTLRYVRALAGEPNQLVDGPLLARFVRHRDETSFAELVRRHGPLVLGVARRRLTDQHAAEDVFQATFLALARQAARRTRRGPLAVWLYTVASRLARKEQARAARRADLAALPPTGAAPVDPLTEVSARELLQIVDDELARMPERYRLPVLLCGLEGLARDEAAARLGWSLGAFRGRLERGRDLLRERLTKRGLTVPAVFVVGLIATPARAVPPGLVAATCRAVMTLPTPTMALAPTLAVAAGILLALGGAGVALLPGGRQDPPPPAGPPARPPQLAEPAPRVDHEGVPLPPGVLARLGSSRMRHSGEVHTVTFAPDGRSLASTGPDGVRVWDTATGRLVRQFPGTPHRPMATRFAAGGRELLVLRGDDPVRKTPGAIHRFDLTTGKELSRTELKAEGVGYSLTIFPSGQRFAVCWIDPAAAGPGRSRVHIHDAAAGREALRIPVEGIGARCLDFAPGDRTLAVADIRDTLRLRDTATGRLTGELKHEGVKSVFAVFSADGSTLATIAAADRDQPRTVELWDVAARTVRLRLPLPEPDAFHTHHVAISADGKFLATCSQADVVLLWDAATGREVRRFRCWPSVVATAFAPDGRTLAAASGNGTITLWDVVTGRLLPASADPIVGVYDLRYLDGGRRLVGAADGLVTWDPVTGRPAAPLPPLTSEPEFAALSPNGRLIVGRAAGAIHVWDAATGREVQVLRSAKPFVWADRFGFTDTRLVATDTGRVMHLFDLTSGRLLRSVPAGVEWVNPLAVSPDGKWLAFADRYARAGADNAIRVWDLAELREVRRLTLRSLAVLALAFSPDGRRLASAGGEWQADNSHGHVQQWDVDTGRELRACNGHTGPVQCLAWAADGRTLATGSEDARVRIWESATGDERLRFTGHAGQISAVAFAPDGRTLAASSPEAPVYVWDVFGSSEFAGRAPTAVDLEQAWAALAGADAKAAFNAIRRLVAAPGPAIAFLRDRLPPAAAVDRKLVQELVRRLDASRFAERQAAAQELEQLADRAADPLRAGVKGAASAEVRQTLQRILDRLDAGTPGTLRAIRSVEILEHIATPAARAHLTALAGGAAGAELTRAASNALKRMEKE
jgi:RNA polymerase sigma factor (sigma-70 family)